MTATALSLYAAAKGIPLTTEHLNTDNHLHREYTHNPMIGTRSLPIMLLANGACVATTHSIIDYIEATRKTPRILSPDPSPNPEQIATIHLYIRAIQNNLYINAERVNANNWMAMFTDFFDDIRNGRRYIHESGFSILDCFFYPATSIYMTAAIHPSDKAILLSYQERVLSHTNPQDLHNSWDDNDY